MCPLLDIPTVSAMSVSFNLHSPNIRTFWMISSVVASFGLPERIAFTNLVLPCLQLKV